MGDKGLEIFLPYRKDWKNGKSNQDRESKQNSSESIRRRRTKNISSIDFSEEDYIVLTLQEDGVIHRKPAKHNPWDNTDTNSARPISRKLMYENNEEKLQHTDRDNKSRIDDRRIDRTNKGQAKTCNKKLIQPKNGDNEDNFQQTNNDHKSSVEDGSIDITNRGQSMTCNKKVKTKRITSVFETKRTITENEMQEDVYVPERSDSNQSNDSFAESSFSNQSDGSSGSFAFPVLSRDGRESPKKMPKPETLNFWKHKKWGVLCLCKRF